MQWYAGSPQYFSPILFPTKIARNETLLKIASDSAVLFNYGMISEQIMKQSTWKSRCILGASEGLSCLLKHAMRTREMEGIQIANTAPKVNHLLFTNNCIFFSKDTPTDATNMKEILVVYCNASGQRVNNDKSFLIFGKGCRESVGATIKTILEVPNEQLNDK
jgi:hypothetical protein